MVTLSGEGISEAVLDEARAKQDKERRTCYPCKKDLGPEFLDFIVKGKKSGPWICMDCRKDPKKLTLVRRLLNVKTNQNYKDTEEK